MDRNCTHLSVIFLLAVAVAGCTTGAETPEEAAEAYTTAVIEEETDIREAYDLLASDARDEVAFDEFEQQDSLRNHAHRRGVELVLVNVENVESSGREATVRVIVEARDGEEVYTYDEEWSMVKEGGWRVGEPYSPIPP